MLKNNTYESEKDDETHDPELSIREYHPAAPPTTRLIVKRGGHSITKQIPKPIILVDTREKHPFDFGRFKNWIGGEISCALKAGDYSIEGMEKLLVLERKTLTDLITTLIQERVRFFKQCEKMTKYRWRALLIEASYEDIKSPYDYDEYNTFAHPNAVSGTLDALEARFGIPVIYTSLYRPMAEEKAASWLSKHFTYWYLENNGFGRVLQEGDL
jgi:ERCC4-type nuclease